MLRAMALRSRLVSMSWLLDSRSVLYGALPAWWWAMMAMVQREALVMEKMRSLCCCLEGVPGKRWKHCSVCCWCCCVRCLLLFVLLVLPQENAAGEHGDLLHLHEQ